ncbi:type III-A CRISPR-associated RAMP protein Csm4 [Methanothermococcus okinawensis]|uniref:CRISPR system Cms protein Csm4 n=1 Tax=Methanothermococcus okinawensis (strain DSM 14208 / JCM 11175 / IH1) TaxID=647113 RepID=F8AJQ7_METOI|nr:type III-A CRISPR-associated RAMP protein Csm4 [Methanothermococcus okinawensis]AEH07255.1 CRISPR-associated RAMP protein, Csm4 family [Methanothermococcus okinawensis IH1]
MYNIIKLIPKENSKYHFGEGDLTESSIVFHSYSLFSAIVNNFVKLYGDGEFEKYKEKIKELKISSLYPAIYQFDLDLNKIDKEILFIPKPMLKLGFDSKTEEKIKEKPKDIKKIKFISLNALKKHNKKELKKITIGEEYLITNKEKDDFKYQNPKNMDLFKKIMEQKVSIDRIKGTTLEDNEKGQLYSIEFIKPLRKKDKNKNIINIVGFYFLIDFNSINEDKDIVKKINASINLIKDEGLGGKRSIGAGTFEDIIIDEFNEEDLDIKYEDLNKKYISKEKRLTLSITVPKDEGEFKSFCNYQLIKIGGYIYPSPNKMEYITKLKKNIYAIAEGSICDKEISGDVKDLKPDGINQEVILNGHIITIPVVFYEELKDYNEEGVN